MIDPKTLSLPARKKFGEKYCRDRERGRTNLLYLCREVLGYRDIAPADPGWEDPENLTAGENHQAILDGLHKFSGRIDLFNYDTLRVEDSQERVAMYDQKDVGDIRNWLFLFPRDHLKTSVITIAQSIQWIINYPDVRILLSFSSGDHGDRIMTAILSHFRYNEAFRWLYPEFCPPADKAKEFGSLSSMTVPNRTRQITEPTLMAVSVGKMIAGTHQDVHIHSDLVDKENVKTSGGINAVIDHYKYTDPLLARVKGKQGWRIVEGTPYDFSDVYGTIRDKELEKEPHERNWHIIERSAEANPLTHKTLWPHRYDWPALKAIEDNVGLYIYNAQYCMRCIAPSGGLATKDQILFIPRKRVMELMPRYRIHTTVDSAGVEEKANGDYWSFTTCGFLPSGYIHIIDVRHGHFTAFQAIEQFFSINARFHPLDFKMEKTQHAQMIEPFLRQEMAKRGVHLNVLNIPRSNTQSKKNRIFGIQPFFQSKRILFVDDLTCMGHLVMEITRFPKFRYDDILDTIADQMQHADGKGIESDLYPDIAEPEENPMSMLGRAAFMGFDPVTHNAIFAGHDGQSDESEYYHQGTGL